MLYRSLAHPITECTKDWGKDKYRCTHCGRESRMSVGSTGQRVMCDGKQLTIMEWTSDYLLHKPRELIDVIREKVNKKEMSVEQAAKICPVFTSDAMVGVRPKI